MKNMTITPEQFNKLATKQDIKDMEERLVSKAEFNKVLTSVDGLAEKIDNFQTELAANRGTHDRFEQKSIRTDKQLSVIERKTA